MKEIFHVSNVIKGSTITVYPEHKNERIGIFTSVSSTLFVNGKCPTGISLWAIYKNIVHIARIPWMHWISSDGSSRRALTVCLSENDMKTFSSFWVSASL